MREIIATIIGFIIINACSIFAYTTEYELESFYFNNSSVDPPRVHFNDPDDVNNFTIHSPSEPPMPGQDDVYGGAWHLKETEAEAAGPMNQIGFTYHGGLGDNTFENGEGGYIEAWFKKPDLIAGMDFIKLYLYNEFYKIELSIVSNDVLGGMLPTNYALLFTAGNNEASPTGFVLIDDASWNEMDSFGFRLEITDTAAGTVLGQYKLNTSETEWGTQGYNMSQELITLEGTLSNYNTTYSYTAEVGVIFDALGGGAVPEPSTILLLLVGIIGLRFRRKIF